MSEETVAPKLNVKVPPAAEVKSPNEFAREESELRVQAEKLRIKRELMEIEKLEYDLMKIKQTQAHEKVTHEQVEAVIADTNRDKENQESACNHMKGGASESFQPGQVVMGNDASNYCMIDHTFSSGVRFRLCQRCGKTWFPKDFDYRWAMSRPSKNTRSIAAGGPALVRNNGPVETGGPRMVSEIPHRSQPKAEVDVSTVPSLEGY
jgi:hypothetical protein